MTTLIAIRGATTVPANTAAAIHAATRELLLALLAANHLEAAAIISGFFSTTPDLTASYPATAARQLGWHHVALLSFQEIPVPYTLPRCIRILLHCGATYPQAQVRFVYLRDACDLRTTLLEQSDAETRPA